MNISSINNHNIYFEAKNKKIRKADKIMRASKHTFPVVSSSYIDRFYSADKEPKSSLKNRVSDNIFEKIERIRIFNEKLTALCLSMPDSEKNILYAPVLRGMEQLNTGNCFESSVGVLGALSANGIYDAEICELIVSTKFTNKKSGKCEYEKSDFLDHCFVVTSMGKNSSKEKDMIIIDPWLSFSESTSSAKAKYKQIFQDNARETFLYNHWLNFKHQKENKDEKIHPKDWEIEQKIYFTIPDFSKKSKDTNKSLGEYCTENFPTLIIS